MEWHGTRGGLSGKERSALKRQTSRANGTKFGRPRKVDDSEHITTAKRMKADGHTGKDIARYSGSAGLPFNQPDHGEKQRL